MNLLICVITYNRLDYTKRTLNSLLKTITAPHYIIVVDNNSTDGTQTWLEKQYNSGKIDNLLLNKTNYYPGKACNDGWKKGLKSYPEATYLVRCDNDMEFFKDWDKDIDKYFNSFKNLGQLGLDYGVIRTAATKWPDENNYIFEWQNFDSPIFKSPIRVRRDGIELLIWPGYVGGLSIIKRELWNDGIRYDEAPWHHDGGDNPTPQEDVHLSTDILKSGYVIGHRSGIKVVEHIGGNFFKDAYSDYYKKTLLQRGYKI